MRCVVRPFLFSLCVVCTFHKRSFLSLPLDCVAGVSVTSAATYYYY